jgi:hypothetical protein
MTSTDLIAHYRHLAEDNRVLALDHTGTSKSLERIASEYDGMAAQLESELAQEQPNQEAGGGETAEFICENCGEHLDRDENAAKNILQFAGVSLPTTAGQAGSKGHGEHVSRVKASAPARNAHRSVNQPSSANV